MNPPFRTKWTLVAFAVLLFVAFCSVCVWNIYERERFNTLYGKAAQEDAAYIDFLVFLAHREARRDIDAQRICLPKRGGATAPFMLDNLEVRGELESFPWTSPSKAEFAYSFTWHKIHALYHLASAKYGESVGEQLLLRLQAEGIINEKDSGGIRSAKFVEPNL
jgi:hypothetical protein